MAQIGYFKGIQADSGDRKYPKDRSKRRQLQANYARMLIGRVRAASLDIIAASRVEKEYVDGSFSTNGITLSQIFSSFERIEQFLDQQEDRANRGAVITVFNPNVRRLLARTIHALYFEMKAFYAAVENGAITERGEVVIPKSGKIEDVEDQGRAVVEAFLNR